MTLFTAQPEAMNPEKKKMHNFINKKSCFLIQGSSSTLNNKKTNQINIIFSLILYNKRKLTINIIGTTSFSPLISATKKLINLTHAMCIPKNQSKKKPSNFEIKPTMKNYTKTKQNQPIWKD
jgi:hypothetical protein